MAGKIEKVNEGYNPPSSPQKPDRIKRGYAPPTPPVKPTPPKK